MDDTNSQDFDWVTRRAECTGAKMFEKIRAGVKRDVEKWLALGSLLPSGNAIRRYAVTLEDDFPREFVLKRNLGDYVRAVLFTYDANTLKATTNLGKVVAKADLILDQDGNYRLKMESHPNCKLHEWVFRYQALEDLFFGTIQDAAREMKAP